MVENKNNTSFIQMKPLFNKFAKAMILKEKTIETHINTLCKIIEIDELTMDGKIT